MAKAKKTSKFQSIGNITKVARSGQAVELICTGGRVRIEILTSDMIRVRATNGREFDDLKSFAISKTDWPAERFEVTNAAAEVTISTRSLRLVVGKRPLGLDWYTAAGKALSSDLPEVGICFTKAGPVVNMSMSADEHFLGLGSKIGPLERRGHSYTMWNTDAAPHTPGRDPMYSSFPVYLSMRADVTYARFFDNPGRSHFDFGDKTAGVLKYDAAGGDLDYYFIHGPTPADVLRRYTELTGRMPLPPRWAIGHQQSRYSYFPDTRVKEIAHDIRKHRIPTDVLYLDIEYMDAYRVFTWDPECFPDPKGLIDELHSLDLHAITIVDPGVKNKLGYTVRDEGMKKEFFLRKSNGRHFVGNVWPGASVFPDFTRADVRRWWGDLHKGFLATGIDGLWNDMNEPAIMGGTFGQSMDEDVLHHPEGEPVSHARLHNVYGMQMARATREGLERIQPEKRHFVLTRAAYCGSQRHTAIWLGDNSSWWEHIASAMPMCMGMGLSGMPFVGVDIGGFFDDCTPELYARWVQMGAFSPFCRTHTCAGTRDQEPWSFGKQTEDIARKYIELRYRLMPYIYTLFWRASRTGCPVMAPLAFQYPQDETCYQVGDEYLWGDSFLVAPVYQEKSTHRAVYLPAGKWVNYWTGQSHKGPAWIVADAPLDTLPLYVRAGSIVPMAPLVQFDGEKPMSELTLDVYAGASGEFTLYEDDGQTKDFVRGAFATTTMAYDEQQSAAGRLTGAQLTVEPRKGLYKPARRKITARFHGWSSLPRCAMLNGKHVQAKLASGGVVEISWPDGGKLAQVVLEA